MSHLDVDILIIGWGKAGKTLAGKLGRAGRQVALIEQSAQMHGGSCINVNCIPTKSLIHQASEKPVHQSPESWFATSVDARDSLTEKLRAANHAMLANVDSVTLIDGRARFIAPHTVEVVAGSERLTIGADTIVINTGTVPAPPPIEGVERSARVFDSTQLQHVTPFPPRLIVVGGGYVGLEFAGMFADFGSAVTVLNRDERLLPHEDPDVGQAVESALADQGVTILSDASADSVTDSPDGTTATVTFTDNEGTHELSADAVLMATGRRPATDDLGLDDAGVVTDERGYVVVDDQLRTNVPGVFAVGDVNGGPQFTYISFDDHRIVLDQLTGSGRRSTADRVAVPNTTFLTPPLASVGLNETQARQQGVNYLIATKPVADIAAMPRPKIVGQTRGLIKILVDPGTDRILGATLLCVDAQELINLIALAMRAGTTAGQLRDGIWIHPSTTEALNEVLAEVTSA